MKMNRYDFTGCYSCSESYDGDWCKYDDIEKFIEDYSRIIAAVLRCNPKPAIERNDMQLEPPWDVVSRISRENDEMRKLLAISVRAKELTDANKKLKLANAVCESLDSNCGNWTPTAEALKKWRKYNK